MLVQSGEAGCAGSGPKVCALTVTRGKVLSLGGEPVYKMC